MALERKPVEESQEPGYPSTNEYITGRRAFIGLLGLTALGVGGVYVLKSDLLVSPPSGVGPGAIPAGMPRPVEPDSTSLPEAKLGSEAAAPQANVPGNLAPPEPIQPQAPVDGGLKPVRPEAQLNGDVIAPEPPARPVTAIKGDVARAKLPEAQPIEQPVPQPAALPETSAAGGIRAPVRPEANIGGKPRPPAQQ